MKSDIVCFGAHADDVEIGMAGTIAKYTSQGKKVIICDLTQADLSSNGSVETRIQEAQQAATLIGVNERLNLFLPDRHLYLDREIIDKVVTTIRTYRPSVVFAPYFIDRHPDHGNCSRIVDEAVFSAGIQKYVDSSKLPAHKVQAVYYYMINSFEKPDFCIDISRYYDQKEASLRAYTSQFNMGENGVMTPLTHGYLEAIEGRERAFGREMGVLFAEGFKSKKPILLNEDLLGDYQ